MANIIKIKNSGISSNTPSAGSLEYGELALNYADGRLFFKKDSSNVRFFTVNEFSNSVISSNTVTVIDTVPLTTFTSIEYTVRLQQGSSASMKLRTSKILVQYNSGTSSVDSTEYAILETGSSAMANVSITVSSNSGNLELRASISDANLTSVNCCVLKTSMI